MLLAAEGGASPGESRSAAGLRWTSSSLDLGLSALVRVRSLLAELRFYTVFGRVAFGEVLWGNASAARPQAIGSAARRWK